MTAAATNIPRTCYTEVSPVVTLDFIESYSKNDFVPLDSLSQQEHKMHFQYNHIFQEICKKNLFF